ncbi:hypothetical protein [Derxia gummosa]|uniref:Uncharacterized protein n=1 Tax=Derxia gummosa DSM 723 TaxID=1121388 RepID=A0A8B6XAD8_9BURK|nr:hypothetical protein [Derxia gummosa]
MKPEQFIASLVQPVAPRQGLIVNGNVDRPLVLCDDTLRALPTRFIDFRATCMNGGIGAARRYRGVALKTLVEAARPSIDRQDDCRRLVIVAEADDGYRALFSWAELFHSPLGDGVFICFDDDEAPLIAREGHFVLVSLMDEVTGPRHVRDLTRIVVQRVF